MKKTLTKTAAFLMMFVLTATLLRVTAFADAIIIDDNYDPADLDVVVAATDGSGYLYFRSGPGMNYDIICNIYDGTVLHINATTTDSGGGFRWGRTSYNGRSGWVSMVHVKSADAPATSTPAPTPTSVSYDVAVQATDGTDYLYLRSGPSMDYEILETIHNGTKLHISTEQKDPGGAFTWGYTEYNGKNGWVSLLHVIDYNQYVATHPTATPTPAVTATPTAAPTAEVTATPEPTASVTAEPEPTEEPEPTAALTPEETKEAEISETPEPTETAEPEGGIAGFLKDKFGNKEDSTEEDSEDADDEDDKEKEKKKSSDKKDKEKDEDEDEDEDEDDDERNSSALFDGKLLVVVLAAIAVVLIAIVVLLILRSRKNKIG